MLYYCRGMNDDHLFSKLVYFLLTIDNKSYAAGEPLVGHQDLSGCHKCQVVACLCVLCPCHFRKDMTLFVSIRSLG